METTNTLIDHVYDSSREYCTLLYFYFIFKRSLFHLLYTKSKLKDSKKHTTTTYRSYNHFDENKFISDITNDLDAFAADKSSIDEDLNIWYSFLLKHSNNLAPIKSKRVKSKSMPDWFTPDIIQIITKTYLYNFDPFKPHFYIVKLGFTGVYIMYFCSET